MAALYLHLQRPGALKRFQRYPVGGVIEKLGRDDGWMSNQSYATGQLLRLNFYHVLLGFVKKIHS